MKQRNGMSESKAGKLGAEKTKLKDKIKYYLYNKSIKSTYVFNKYIFLLKKNRCVACKR